MKGACIIYTVFFVSYMCISTCQTEVAVIDQLGKCASTKAHESRRRVFILPCVALLPPDTFTLLQLSPVHQLRATYLSCFYSYENPNNCPSPIIMAAPADITIKNLNGEWVLVC